jgi:hypothetical protein
MYEDDFLESDYEDRYTIQGDVDEEDKSYIEDDSYPPDFTGQKYYCDNKGGYTVYRCSCCHDGYDDHHAPQYAD